ncbi:MAG TPA: class I SAM-dependent methyltransferase, partial [Rhodanobacter sp.]|nr:class I SAM-dependent methyltransferase [Rhodanobacter sp.]
VQTLHPLMACGGQPYRDGWREGSWDGFEGSFSDPAPWYFRTLESWLGLFRSSGLQLCELREPLHPVSGKPASVIFIAQLAR